MGRRLLDQLWKPLQEAGRNFQRNDGLTQAAAIAYYAAFSLLPLLLLSIAVLGVVMRFSSGAQNARQEVLELLSKNTSPELAEHVSEILGQISARAVFGGPIALATLLLTAIGVFAQIEHAFSIIWKTPEKERLGVFGILREALFYRFRAFLMLLGAGIFLLAAFAAGIVSTAFHDTAARLSLGGWAWNGMEAVTVLVMFILFFTLIFKTLPKTFVRWAAALQGGCLTAVLWEAARQLLSRLLLGQGYSAYGVVGSLIAVMLWIYIAAMILLLGAEYVRVRNGETLRDPD